MEVIGAQSTELLPLSLLDKESVVEELVGLEGVDRVGGVVDAVAWQSAGVAYDNSLHVDTILRRGGLIEVVVVDGEGQVGDVDPCVALACDVELVGCEFGELAEKYHQGLQVVICGGLVGVVGFAGGEAHAGRTLEEKQVRPLVPGVVVKAQFGRVVVESQRAYVVEGPDEAGAARAPLEEQHQRVLLGVAL